MSALVRPLFWLCFAAIWLGAFARIAQVPVWGSTDRGDFWRVTETAGLVPIGARDPERVVRFYRLTAAKPLERPSSAGWLALAATLVPRALHASLLDVRVIGALGLALLLAACLWLRRSGPEVAASALLLSWAAVDPGYLRYFNSFYAEPALIAGLFGLTMAWLVLPRALDRASLPAVLALGALASFAKQPCAPIAAAFGLAALVAATRMPAVRRRCLLLGSGLIAISLAAGLHFAVGRGHRFPPQNGFNAVFTGIAVVSDRPGEVLRRLGLPSELRSLVGKDAFAPDVPPSALRAAARVSRLRIAACYLGEPQTLVRVARRAGQMLAFDPPWGLGQWQDGRKPGIAAELSFATFSGVRALLYGGGPAAVWTWLALLSLWLAVRLRRWNALSAVSLALWLVFFSQLAVAVLGDGLFSLSRHLLAARFALDALAALALVDLAGGPLAAVLRGASARLLPVAARVLVQRDGRGDAGVQAGHDAELGDREPRDVR